MSKAATKTTTKASTTASKAKAKKPVAKTKKSNPAIDLPAERDGRAYNTIKLQALTEYHIGRDATYKAIALTYIWYELASTLPAYLEVTFSNLTDQTNSHKYAKALKVCLKLDTTLNASTISKYKKVMLYLHHKLKNHKIDTGDDATVNKVVKVITDAKGIDGCVNKLAEIGAAKRKTKVAKKPQSLPSQKTVDGRLKRYKSKATKAKASFAKPAKLKAPKSKLVVMIGRVANDNNLEVVDVIANDKLVEYVTTRK